MATDPQQLLVGLVGTTGLAPQLALQNAQQQNALNAQSIQQNQYLQQQEAQQQQAAQQFNQDVLDYTRNPTPQGLSNLAFRYPQQAQAFKTAADLKDAPQREADALAYGNLWNAADKGKSDLVQSLLTQRQQAMKNAGQDTTNLDYALSLFGKGDDAGALNFVKGSALIQLNAHDPEALAKLGAKETDEFSNTPQGFVYNKHTGLGPNGETGGGGLASSGVGAADGSGGPDTSRLVNSDAGGGQVPASVQNLGQFVAWGAAKNRAGAKSSSAGTYQINGSTVREFAPQALGADWQNAPYTADTQDKIGEAIFNWAKTQSNPAAALKGRWVSLSSQQAAQLVKGSWNQAKATIAQGETGGGAGASANAGGGQPLQAVGGYSAAAIDNAARAYNQNGGKFPSGLPKGGAVQAAIANRAAQLTAAQNDDSSTGDAYLATLSPGRANLLRAINEGRAPAPRPGSKFGEQLSEDLSRAFPGVDTTQFAVKQQVRKDFTGNGKAAQQFASYNRFAAHLNDAWNLSQQLGGANLGPLSGMAAGVTQSFSPGLVKDYETAVEGIAGEFQKLTKNGAASETETSRLISNAKAAQSAQGRNAALHSMAALVAGAYQPAVNQWRSAFPNQALPVDVTPQAKAAINNVIHGGKTGLATGPSGAPVGNNRTFVNHGGPARFSHMSASGKYGWNGQQWVAVH